VDTAGAHWRAFRTPDGPATLRVVSRPDLAEIDLSAWGPGADWALDQAPALLGADDDPTEFVAHHPLVAELARRHPHWRIGRTGLVVDALVPAIIEQKVTGQEAFAAYRRLVQRYGEPAPGPVEDLHLRVQPTPEGIRAIPSWEWLRLPVDSGRSRPLLGAMKVAPALERAGRRGADDLDRALTSLPGIGRWTSAEVRQRALGDADAVSFGDYHVAKDIGWALTGERIDDDALGVLLEPYRPHRFRVQALLALARSGAPRRGPRMAPRRHLPTD